MSSYLILFAAVFFISLILTPLVKLLAERFKIFDIPDEERKKHKKPVPLLGGLAIFFSFFAVIFYLYATGKLFGDFIRPAHVFGIFIGSIILMAGGFLDDKYNLKPKIQIIFPVLAALAVVLSGINVTHIRNLFGGIISFDYYSFYLLNSEIIFPGSILTFFWLLGMMYTTKILDGLDGLAAGISSVGSFVIFLVCLLPFVRQTDTALIAIIFCGAALGFLPWNFHPAKIFLGEGGSVFLGFILGVLAIISGSKVATMLLVMGIPILDVLWVILRRLFWEKKSPALSDRKHLHYRLLDVGLSERQAVIFLYLISAIFGCLSLFLQTSEKAVALAILLLVMVILAFYVVKLMKKKDN